MQFSKTCSMKNNIIALYGLKRIKFGITQNCKYYAASRHLQTCLAAVPLNFTGMDTGGRAD